MRRRVVVFEDKDGMIYSTPEFNGDKEAYEMRGMTGKSVDGCSKNWDEILKDFESVTTLEEFKKASEKAQGYYWSFLGEVEILPVVGLDKSLDCFNADEIYIVENGKVKLH